MEHGPGLKMYVLLNMGIFHCHVSLPEGKYVVFPARSCSVQFFCGSPRNLESVVGFFLDQEGLSSSTKGVKWEEDTM